MQLSQKVALNTIIQIVTKVITVIFGFLTMVILTRYLGVGGYGNYMYVLTLVVLFGGFADWGTATIGVREAAKDGQKQNLILSNVFLIRVVLSLIAALLMILAAFYLPLKTNQEILIRQGIVFGSFILVLYAIKASFGIIFQTKLQMQKLAVSDITASFLIFLISWLFIHFHLGLIYLLIAVILANVIAVILAAILAIKTIEFKFQMNLSFIKSFFKECLPMGALLLLFTIYNKVDTVILGIIKGNEAVGIYAVGYRLYDVLVLGAAYFMNSLLPVLSQYSNIQKWRDKIRIIYQKSFDVLLMMGGLVLILTLILAPLAIRLITQQRFGEFFDAVLVVRLLSLAIFISYFNHLTGFTIVALGRQKWYFLIAAMALILNVIANFMVIPKFSYYGAAVVTIFTEGFVLMVTSFSIFRLIGFFPTLKDFPKTFKELIINRGKVF